MKMFDEYNPMFLLIGGLVLWYFIGSLTNSISEKKPNAGVKKNKTKYSKKNRTTAKHIKEKRRPSTAYIWFNVIVSAIGAIGTWVGVLFSLPVVAPIVGFILILLIFVY